MGRLMEVCEMEVDRRPGKTVPVLPADLAGSARLRTNLGAERVDFIDDQLLHPFDRILLFE
jgi:hypothetical protein